MYSYVYTHVCIYIRNYFRVSSCKKHLSQIFFFCPNLDPVPINLKTIESKLFRKTKQTSAEHLLLTNILCDSPNNFAR